MEAGISGKGFAAKSKTLIKQQTNTDMLMIQCSERLQLMPASNPNLVLGPTFQSLNFLWKLFAGAFMFIQTQKWNFLNSIYFCFITLSTIGFGDFVPKNKNNQNIGLTEDQTELVKNFEIKYWYACD